MKFNYITIKKLVRISIVLLMVCFVMFLKIDNVKANINPAINFTGKITNTDGTEISDGNYNVSFGLYASSTGSSAIWSEDLTVANCFSATISNVNGTVYTYNNDSNENTLRLGQYLTNSSATGSVLIIDYNTTDNTITVASGSPAWVIGQNINNRPYVEGGVININLGSISDLSGVDFYQKLYLEVIFNGETMQPRKVLTSVAQAFEAARIGGKTESELAGLFENEQITGEWSFDNILNIATSSESTSLTVTQTGTGDLINFFDGGNEVFTITDGGFVGIGTTTPGYLLDVYGQGNFNQLCLSGSCVSNWGAAGSIDGSASAGQVTYWSADTTLAGENQLAVIRGGTGIGAYAIGDIIYANATNTLARLATSTAGSILQLDLTTGLPSYVSTSSLNIAISDTTGTLQIARGGTGIISYNAGDLIYASSDNNLSTLASSTDGYILTLSNGYPAWVVNNDGVVNYGQEGSLTFYSSSGTTATGTTNSLLYWDDINSRLGIGTTSPMERLFVNGNIMVNGDILSYASSSIGSAGVRMHNGYFDNLDVTNLSFGSTTVSGAVSNVFTINSDNSTDDTENSYLAFDRGTVTPNALLAWNAIDDRFEMNFPLYLESNNFLTLGNIGIGTTTPSSTLTIGDNNQFTVTLAGAVDATSLTLDNALAVAQGGTGATTVSDARTNLGLGVGNSPTFAGITVNGNIVISGEIDGIDISSASSTWDTAVSWGDHSDAGYLTLTTWYATTTDALSEGSNNLYWTNERFDTRLSATSSLSNIISLSGLSQIGTIATGTWNADVIGIAYGGTGATTATSARENLDLDEVYKFGINATGTNGEIWQSDGDGRGHWVTQDSIDGKKSKFIGITSTTTNGFFATGTLSGYVAANDICNSEYAGSHFCRTYDIIVSIEQDDISGWGNDTMSAWIAEGPPGYTSDSNDCKGWKDSDSSVLGAYWKFNSTGGGAGWLIHCGNQLPIACCSWQ